jgi:hypothetical protein
MAELLNSSETSHGAQQVLGTGKSRGSPLADGGGGGSKGGGGGKAAGAGKSGSSPSGDRSSGKDSGGKGGKGADGAATNTDDEAGQPQGLRKRRNSLYENLQMMEAMREAAAAADDPAAAAAEKERLERERAEEEARKEKERIRREKEEEEERLREERERQERDAKPVYEAVISSQEFYNALKGLCEMISGWLEGKGGIWGVSDGVFDGLDANTGMWKKKKKKRKEKNWLIEKILYCAIHSLFNTHTHMIYYVFFFSPLGMHSGAEKAAQR